MELPKWKEALSHRRENRSVLLSVRHESEQVILMQDEYDAGIFSAMKEEIAALKAENANLLMLLQETRERLLSLQMTVDKMMKVKV